MIREDEFNGGPPERDPDEWDDSVECPACGRMTDPADLGPTYQVRVRGATIRAANRRRAELLGDELAAEMDATPDEIVVAKGSAALCPSCRDDLDGGRRTV